MEQMLKQKNEKWLKAQELEKNLSKHFIELGKILTELRSDVRTKEEFEENVNAYLKCGLTKAYSMINIWEHRDSIDFEKYGMWKADELLKIRDENERKEFEQEYKPEERSVRETRENIKEFKLKKEIEKIDKEDFNPCIRFWREVENVYKSLKNLEENYEIIKYKYEGLLTTNRDLWLKFPKRQEIEKKINELKRKLEGD